MINDKKLLVNSVKTEIGQKRLLAHYSLETSSGNISITLLTY